MKKITKNFAILSLFSTLLFVSCANNANSPTPQSIEEKAMLKIELSQDSFARTVTNTRNLTDELTKLVLKGRFENETNDIELAKADTAAALCAKTIEIRTGKWVFSLTAELSGQTFSGTKELNIAGGKTNTISFLLKSSNTKGGLDLTINFEGDADSLKLKLMDAEKTKTLDSSTHALTAEQTSFNYKKLITDNSQALAQGTYYFRFDFYKGEEFRNKIDGYIRITGGITTIASTSLNLNETYTITYVDNGGNLVAGATKINIYSRRTEYNLPKMQKDGYLFVGWYEDENFAGNAFLKLQNNTGNRTFYACFVDTLHIAPSPAGNNTNNGYSSVHPLASIEKALNSIAALKEAGHAANNIDWKIIIHGNLTGDTAIPATFTGEQAHTLCIQGEANGKDKIQNLSSATDVPFILKNIHIDSLSLTNNKIITMTTGSNATEASINGTLVLEDDAYVSKISLDDNSFIKINTNLTTTNPIEIKPEHYTQALQLLSEKTSGLIGTNYTKFTIRQLTDGTTCTVDENGKLLITIPVTVSNVTVEEDRTDINVSFEKNENTYTFTAGDEYSSYKWYFDGDLQTETSRTFTIDMTNKPDGVYYVILLAEKTDGTHQTYHSYYATITIPAPANP